MHLEDAVVDADDLVAKDGQVWAVFGAVHSDGQLRGVAVLLSAHFHVAALNKDVVGVESSLVVRIVIGREDQRAFHVEEGENGGAVDIE